MILICVDTLRADRLPAYGYSKIQTPHLDAFRKDAILFENAYSHVPLTLPSHAALFTGLLPPQNGVRDNLGYQLGPAPVTLAGFLQGHGYATGGAVSSIVLAKPTGVSRGFEFYEDDVEPMEIGQSLGRVQREGSRTAALLTDWIRSQKEKPVFAFLHIFEPHSPYDPPEPYRSRYTNAYDGEVARADEIVGNFLEELKSHELYDRSVVVFFSDHGEGLRDHGEEEHGVLLYRESIHVPLMLKLPRSRQGGETVTAPAALTDLFPTICRLLGLAHPAGLAGRPLTELASARDAPGPRRIYSETLYPRLHLGWSDLASLIDDRHHYIEAPRPELYDFVADPAEKRDLAGALPPAFRSMRAQLLGMPRPLQPPGASDPEQVAKLAALGYVSATTSDLTSKDLPDPKDRVESVDQLKNGFGHLQKGRFVEAARTFRALVADNPRMIDVWQLLAQAEMKLGRPEDAFAALKEAAKLAPGNPQVLLALSEYFTEVGRFAEARQHAELARDVGAADSRTNIAKIALAQGDLATAEAEAKASLQERPGRRIPHLILGRVQRDRRNLAGALEELDRVVELTRQGTLQPLYNVNYLRGDIFARMGREREAEEAFRQEMRDFPSAPPAYAGLAMLYASQGKEGEARGVLEELVSARTPDAIFTAAHTFEILGDPASAGALRARARRLFPGARDRRQTSG
ncbi:MAG: sulfatase-like hydrolase/transferase [Thermoanaerobaculia bacterium]